MKPSDQYRWGLFFLALSRKQPLLLRFRVSRGPLIDDASLILQDTLVSVCLSVCRSVGPWLHHCEVSNRLHFSPFISQFCESSSLASPRARSSAFVLTFNRHKAGRGRVVGATSMDTSDEQKACPFLRGAAQSLTLRERRLVFFVVAACVQLAEYL